MARNGTIIVSKVGMDMDRRPVNLMNTMVDIVIGTNYNRYCSNVCYCKILIKRFILRNLLV